MNSLQDDLKALLSALGWYSRAKVKAFGKSFEKSKNAFVSISMHGRGAYQKHIWHGSIVTLASLAVGTSIISGGNSIVSSTYPGFGGPDPRFASAFEPYPNGPVLEGFGNTQTNISAKPRSEIIEYEVHSGDTLSSIAQKFNITSDTIKWANDLTDTNQIKPGQKLKILPVSGIAYTVKSGDTVESVAKKFSASAQAIVDFPFNDVPDDFQLKSGQQLIVPDGVPPEAPAPKKPQPQYLAQGPASPTFTAPYGANFIWPTTGIITQYFAWYHPGIDIANRVGPVISAADGGVVTYAGWDNTGYGNRTDIDHGNGYVTRYGHQSNIYVTVGEHVSRGQIIGQMGSTGRSTGTHLHLEIHYRGIAVNPLAILK